MVTLDILPECFGTYDEGHPDCDGNPDAEDALSRVPCSVRERCGIECEKPAQRAERPGFDEALEARRRQEVPSPEAMALYAWFKERLAVVLGAEWPIAGQAPTPGQLHEADHYATARYFAVFLRAKEGPFPIARVKPHKSGRVSIMLPTTFLEAKRLGRSKGGFSIVEMNSGFFQACAPNLDRTGAGIAADVAAVILKAKRDL